MSRILDEWKCMISQQIYFEDPESAIKEAPFFTQRYLWCADKLNYSDMDILSDLVDFADETLRRKTGYERENLTEDVIVFIGEFHKIGDSAKLNQLINKIKQK